MTLCSVILFLTNTDLCDFLHRLLLVEGHDLYRLRRVALPLGTTEREEVGLPGSLCWAVGGVQVIIFGRRGAQSFKRPEDRPRRGRNGVSTAQLLGVTAGGCYISSVRSGSAEATAPASTLHGEVQMPR